MAQTDSDSLDDEAIKIDESETLSIEDSGNGIFECDSRGDLTLIVGRDLNTEGSATKLRVCSKTLARVSPVLSSMLYGSFSEAKDSANWTVDLPEDDPDAFKLFSSIAHGHLHKIPASLPLDDLFELTMLTHYYDATRILAPWAARWMVAVSEPRPQDEEADQKLLWVAFELGARKTFEITARRMLVETVGWPDGEDGCPMLLDLRSKLFEWL